MIVGFSTGSLCKSDFRTAINWSKKHTVRAIELSALRESELPELLDSLGSLDLTGFKHISFHAPSKIINLDEAALIKLLKPVQDLKWDIVVHPDIITDFSLWRSLGGSLCIENMDNRKKVGQSIQDLEVIFKLLPEASLCFDIAHSKQIDPSMDHGFNMLYKFRHRLKQVHISHVNESGEHLPITPEDISDYKPLVDLIQVHIPIIIESPVQFDLMETEIDKVHSIFL